MKNGQKRKSQAGVTILEVLVVLSIIAMIAAVVGPRLIGYLGRAQADTAAMQVDQIGNALKLYYIDMGRYPTGAEGLAVLMAAPATEAAAWDGPYLEDAKALQDPWGRDYVYTEASGEAQPTVVSFGRDGQRGGSDEDADIGG